MYFLSPATALQDCAHELWQEELERIRCGVPAFTVLGPCSRGCLPFPPYYCRAYTRCLKCHAIFCFFCAANVAEAAGESEDTRSPQCGFCSVTGMLMGCVCDNRHSEWQWKNMILAWQATLPRTVVSHITTFIEDGWKSVREKDLEALIG